MELKDIRGKDSAELKLDAQELQQELFGLRLRSASEEISNTSRFREIRRTVARIRTVLREREIADATTAKAGAN